MIHFDLSRSQKAKHRSGLTRVSSRLLAEFGDAVRPAAIFQAKGVAAPFDAGAGKPGSAAPATTGAGLRPGDWLLTAELFCEEECPGLWQFVRVRRCRLAAIYHDAIPLRLPHVTWPRSVSRHPEYMKVLAEFDRVFAVSEASRRELLGYWRWLGVSPRAKVETVSLGADFAGERRRPAAGSGAKASLVCVGILEPRKNQEFLLGVCETLWNEGLAFDLHVVGRVNPHFGRPAADRVKALRREGRSVIFHEAATDAQVARLYAEARASVFPTVAEGCGLPLLESLWQGVPCVCSDLPVLRENADGGGCVPVAVNDRGAWAEALRRVLTDEAWRAKLAAEAGARALPTWAEAAQSLLARLR